MSINTVNLDIDVATDYYIETLYEDDLTKLPMDLTGYSAIMKIRPSWDDPVVFQTLSSNNGRIMLGGITGKILVHLLPEDTDPSNIAWTRAVYDIVLTDSNGIIFKLVSGMINLIGTASI